MWKESIKLGQIHQSHSHKLQSNTQPCHSRNAIFPYLWKRPQPTTTPTSRTNVMIPRRSRIWLTQPGSTLSSTSYCQENTGWKLLQWTLPAHWKSSHWKNKVMQCQRCSTQTTSWILEYQHTIWQSWKIHQPFCEFANYQAHWLRWKSYSCTKSHVYNLHWSSLQHSRHDHTHQYNNTGESGVSITPTSIQSLPHMSFLDHHTSCIIGKSREATENAH